MRSLHSAALPICTLCITTLVHAACPGAMGDTFCQSITSRSGVCVPGQWTCLGTTVACGCDFSAAFGTTSAPSPTKSFPFTFRSSIPPSTETSSRPSESPISPTTTLPTTAIPASTTNSKGTADACDGNPTRPIFIWAEWPDVSGPLGWMEYYSTLLAFIGKNCGNFNVRKLILRVTDPTISGLWTVSTTSVFYKSFLSKLPEGIDLKLYPYVLDSKAQQPWVTYSGQGRSLEGAFKFASDWNALLSSQGSAIRFSGVVVDGEEKSGFMSEIPQLPNYKSKYSLTFGAAIGFDTTSSISQYGACDEFYLELYDFYKVGAPKLTLVQTSASDSPSSFLDKVSSETLTSFVSDYQDRRFEFMWSVQAKSRRDCLYPLGSGCGSSDDFGLFSASEFGTFLDLVQSKYPQLSGRSHGIFQFSFVPVSWQ